jgi:hypothetical protein
MCSPGTVCRNGVCIPNDRDIDGDTFPASTDCDEQNPDVHPGGTEVCNAIDDDCSMTVDDGDPAVLCSGAQAGNVCVMGSCVANLGYIQVVRHCNHFCGFCSNPTTPYTHTFASMQAAGRRLRAARATSG